MIGAPYSVAVIGAGFSGTLMAVHLLRRCRPGDRVYLIDRRASFGRGLAYSTSNSNHLLNVRAANMSAFHDDPDHFVAWLRREHGDLVGAVRTGDCFVSRQLYGAYLRSLLRDELWANRKGRNLYFVPDQVVSLDEDADGVSVTVAVGRRYRVDVAVLALGNLPRGGGNGAYYADPWHPQATAALDPNASVLLLGSGLTMIDTVQSLFDAGHRGPIRAVSRRGLLPQRHAPTDPIPFAIADLPRTTSVARLTRWVREQIRQAEAHGRTWRCVVDGLRPHVQDLWRRLPLEERRRFLRHLRPWWDAARHRVAPAVADQVERAIRSGRLRVGPARAVDLVPGPASVGVWLRRRGADSAELVDFDRVIDCTGPQSDFRSCADPLIRDLVRRGVVRPDPLGLGLEVGEQGALTNGSGIASSRLFAVGPVTRGTFWEIVAVPDIRMHCTRLASHLAEASAWRRGGPATQAGDVAMVASPDGGGSVHAARPAAARTDAPAWFDARPRYGDR